MRPCGCYQYTRAADLAFVFLSENFRNVIAAADRPPTAWGGRGCAGGRTSLGCFGVGWQLLVRSVGDSGFEVDSAQSAWLARLKPARPSHESAPPARMD